MKVKQYNLYNAPAGAALSRRRVPLHKKIIGWVKNVLRK